MLDLFDEPVRRRDDRVVITRENEVQRPAGRRCASPTASSAEEWHVHPRDLLNEAMAGLARRALGALTTLDRVGVTTSW